MAFCRITNMLTLFILSKQKAPSKAHHHTCIHQLRVFFFRGSNTKGKQRPFSDCTFYKLLFFLWESHRMLCMLFLMKYGITASWEYAKNVVSFIFDIWDGLSIMQMNLIVKPPNRKCRHTVWYIVLNCLTCNHDSSSSWSIKTVLGGLLQNLDNSIVKSVSPIFNI